MPVIRVWLLRSARLVSCAGYEWAHGVSPSPAPRSIPIGRGCIWISRYKQQRFPSFVAKNPGRRLSFARCMTDHAAGSQPRPKEIAMTAPTLAETSLPNTELPPLTTEVAPARLLDEARARARTSGLNYAGGLYPPEAWQLVASGKAVLVDVRTAEELKFVGRVPGALHVAWQTGPAMIKNPRFLRELENKVGKDDVVLFLCRSGKRSAAAAEAATAKGFSQVFNILEGFEGDLDNQQQRGDSGGWRRWGLPWVQD